ncbi:unnamed protein product [Nezara viridula]|uniref:Uncharacterized protein n=1 Tax=Nezara viridula TaxID=85310 RepID=A0A9P0HNQ4_NEZVI|nr:unnamed protein product [Nezara viridula]
MISPHDISAITAEKMKQLRSSNDPVLRKMVLVNNLLLKTTNIGSGDCVYEYNAVEVEDDHTDKSDDGPSLEDISFPTLETDQI